jgi:hypothetical protein
LDKNKVSPQGKWGTKVQSLVGQKDISEKAPNPPLDYQMTWKRPGHDPWVSLQNIRVSIPDDLKGIKALDYAFGLLMI